MSHWYHYEVEKQRREDEISQRNRQRAQEATEREQLIPMPRYQRFLVTVGESMVVWGVRLQARYTVDVPTFPKTSNLRG